MTAVDEVRTPRSRSRLAGLGAAAALVLVVWSLSSPDGPAVEPLSSTPLSSTPASSEPQRSTVPSPTERTGQVLDGARPAIPAASLVLAGDTGLSVLDLATGQVTGWETAAGDVPVIRGELALVQNGAATSIVDLGTGASVGVRLGGESGSQSPTRDPAPAGHAWFVVADAGHSWAAELDLSTGETARRVELPDRWLWAADGRVLLGSPQSGGVYDLSGPEPELILERGTLVAAVGTRLLVEQCDEQLSCALSWFDGRTGVPIDRLKIPSLRDATVAAIGGNWLLLSGSDYETSRLFDIETGRLVRPQDPTATSERLAVSPDGAWLAEVGVRDVVLTRLSDGEAFPLELPLTLSLGGWTSIAWYDESGR